MVEHQKVLAPSYTPGAMNRGFFRKWARWLLPLLVMRACLPAGFMLSAHAGSLELVFCPSQTVLGQLFQPDAGQGSAHAGVFTHHGDHSQDQALHHAGAAHAPDAHAGAQAQDAHGASAHEHAGAASPASSCLYALAATAIITVAQLDVASPAVRPELIEERSVFLPGAGPCRAERIRGPPSFS